MSDNPACPYCKKIVDSDPINRWKYGKYDVSRYHCNCGKKFNSYTSDSSRFTIPKHT